MPRIDTLSSQPCQTGDAKVDSISAQAQRLADQAVRLLLLAGNLRHRIRSIPESAANPKNPVEPRSVSDYLHLAEEGLRDVADELNQLDTLIGG